MGEVVAVKMNSPVFRFKSSKRRLSAEEIGALRKFSPHSVAEIARRASSDDALLEVAILTGDWPQSRPMLETLLSGIETGALALRVVLDDEELSVAASRQYLATLREIELQQENHSPLFVDGAGNPSMPEATVIPVLLYADVPAAVSWLCRAFGFRERLRIGNHRVQLQVGSGAVVVARGSGSPSGHSIMVRIANADEHHARSVAAGAKVLSPPVSFPYGERQYSVTDPGGHAWTFSQTESSVNPESWGGQSVRTN